MRRPADIRRIVRRHGRRQWARAQAWRSPAHRRRYHAQCDPSPLLDPSQQLMVLWTPKVASSTLAIWFWTVTGVRDSARAFSADPHRYRQRVHYPSADYGRALAMDLSAFTVLKVVRDPHQRAVSSYRHALRQGYYDDEQARHLGRPVDADRGYSFLEYLDLLERTPARSINPHDRPQRHRVETSLPPTHVVRLGEDDLFGALEGLERTLGVPPTGIRHDEWVALVEGRRSPGARADDGDPGRPLARTNAVAGGAWPASASLLTDPARARVAALYRDDLAAYFGAAR